MQLRSGKKIGTQGLTKAPTTNPSAAATATATPLPSDKDTFVSHMKYLLKCVSDFPSETMDRINGVYDVMHWASLDENIKFARASTIFTQEMIAACDVLQHQLLEYTAKRQQLTKTESTQIMKTHDILTKTRIKYQTIV